MKKEAPVWTPILAGVVITTAEAMETHNPIIELLAVDLKEIRGVQTRRI